MFSGKVFINAFDRNIRIGIKLKHILRTFFNHNIYNIITNLWLNVIKYRTEQKPQENPSGQL